MSAECITVMIDPVDSLMFRDGRPFSQADPGASRAVSVFPPFPPTVVGTIRFALLNALGTWRAELLGDGTDWQDPATLGPLAFGAPLVLHDGAPVFPVPLHILEGKDSSGTARLTRLLPGKERSCDLGGARLPVPVDRFMGVKPIEDRWLTAEGMQTVLEGGVPKRSDLVDVKKKLWGTEPRVGIGISQETRTTSEGRLYMASHVRTCPEVRLSCELRGYTGPTPGAVTQTMGGEHRMVQLDFASKPAPLPELPTARRAARYCAILLSPLVLTAPLTPGGAVEGLPGQMISACLGKAARIGGWNSQARRHRGRHGGEALPMWQAIPAGSVFFMEADAPPPAGIGGALGGIGQAWGFGQALIGTWGEGKNS